MAAKSACLQGSGDPAREQAVTLPAAYKNLDLPANAYPVNGSFMSGLASVPRPGFNSTGREASLKLNAYPIEQFPTRDVYQYDVTISSENPTIHVKRQLARKVWNCAERRQKLKQVIWDGAKLAWSFNIFPDTSILVDLDVEYGHKDASLSDQSHVYRLYVRKSKKINLQVIDLWLQKKMPFDEDVLQALNFLDHLIRENPSQKYTAFKRAFYDPDHEPGAFLDYTINVFKGWYQAIRPTIGPRLVINVDIEVCAFWQRTSLAAHARTLINAMNIEEVADRAKPKNDDPNGGYIVTPEHDYLWSKLRRLEVIPCYHGTNVKRSFFVKYILPVDASKFEIKVKDPVTGKERPVTLQNYFKERYNIQLRWPNLPVVEMSKPGIYYPMEAVGVVGLQRYNFKLTEEQTSRMLKVAVQRPADRLKSVEEAKSRLDHGNDPVLRHFGMRVSNDMIRTKARILPSPEIQFGNQKHNPGTAGRWDLRGKKFLKGNRVPLRSWGCGIITYRRNTLEMTQAENWISGFMKTYAGHGGQIANKPVITVLSGDIANAIAALYQKTGNTFNQRPQLLIFFAPHKDSWTYLRIKKSCDCRFGVPSQVLQSQQVVKMNPQYMSNVAMKVNAKLGGVTARSIPRHPDSAFRPGSIIIGADVSHASPGSWAPSLSAIAVSADEYGVKYMGNCETGLQNVEIISEENMKDMLTPLIDEWTKTVGRGRRPQYVFYFRDGVSTGQFPQVLSQEVPVIKQVIMQGSGEKNPPRVCVVIANKRHHIRAFPDPKDKAAADRNGNPVPGTLIERDITSPHDWDFLLYPHVALQGTARAVHYHVIKDEIGLKPNQLQNMIYEHSYQYVRSTTSVSLFPAIYYAHLISNRARHHENVPASQGPTSGPYIKLTDKAKNAPDEQSLGNAPKRLLQMVRNETRNHLEMWFV